MQAIMEGDKAMVPMAERIYGRTLVEDVIDTETGEILARGMTTSDSPDFRRSRKESQSRQSTFAA